MFWLIQPLSTYFLTSLTFDMYYRHMLCISNELCFVAWYLFWYFIQIYFVITCILTYFWILGHDDCILFYIDYVLSLLCLGFELSIWHIYYESCVMILYLLSCLWANLIIYESALFEIEVHFIFSLFICFHQYACLALGNL